MTCSCVALLVSRVPCLCCLFRPQTFGVSRHLGHLHHGASRPCLAKTFGAPATGAGYLLVNNPVFQLEPSGLSVLCSVLCAVGCCENKPDKKTFFCTFFFVPFCPRLVSWVRFCISVFKLSVFFVTAFSLESSSSSLGLWCGLSFSWAAFLTLLPL